MVIDQKLLEIICCPETKQDLKVADEELISRLNRLVERKELKNRIKQPVEKKTRWRPYQGRRKISLPYH